ncbi:MAG: molybdopterin molybdotransferase MoeA [Rhizobiaceae bacterium]|nr:MAG: molybdopterin molybdotransferase MoeA [Rhizobiaceae bacterium]
MALLPVDEALARLLDDVDPVEAELLPLHDAAGRVLAHDIVALRTQPPFDASAMDGYAVRAADTAVPDARLRVIGEAPAGRLFPGKVGPGEAVRIFTGAPMPDCADAVLIQENTRRIDAQTVEVTQPVAAMRNVRLRGLDFRSGDVLLPAGRRLDPAALSLAASANHPAVPVARKPLVAIVATGDELLPPGSITGPDQIIASNVYGIAAAAREAGADVLDLGIAPDRKDAIAALVREAASRKADVVVTIGGASVGDHDFIHDVLTSEGVALAFWKVAMRPGKPLMFGRRDRTRVLGLPGNPVASLICAQLFLKPLIARLCGADYVQDMREAVMGKAVPANDARQDYVRASIMQDGGRLVATAFDVQDSSMLQILARSDALIVREPHAPAAEAGAMCRVLMLR